MKVSILISLSCLISFLVGCADTPTKSILEERAGYSVGNPSMGIQGLTTNGVRYVPTRTPEKVVVPWLFPHELPTKDYFWGSWLSVIVAPEGWEMTKVELPKGVKPKLKRAEDRPTGAPPKRKKAVVNAAT